VTYLTASIQDAVIAQANVGGQLTTSKNRAPNAAMHGVMHAHIRVNDGTPPRNTAARKAVRNGSARARVIDGDHKSGMSMTARRVDRAKNRPSLRRGTSGVIVEKAKE